MQDTAVKGRISLLMFIQFFVLGTTSPIISLYMKEHLHFSGTQIGWVLATSAASSFISPIINAFIADRYISAEKLLSVSHFVGAAIMVCLISQFHFMPFLLLYLIYWLIVGPTTALTTAVTFHHLPGNRKKFGMIRAWGTAGWFIAAWVYLLLQLNQNGFILSNGLKGALQLSAFSSFVLGFYSLTLPSSIACSKSKVVLIPKDSLKVILRPEVLMLSAFCILITFVDRFYVFGAGPYLSSIGFQDKNILPVLSIGQFPELFVMGLLGFFLSRFGLKRTLLLGVLFEVIRFSFFALNVKGGLIFLGIGLHGVTYALFFTPLSIFLDSKSDKYSRAGAHQLFSIITGGIGNLFGNLLAGFSSDLSTIPGSDKINYPLFWSIPLLISIIGFGGIMLFIKEESVIEEPYVRTSVSEESA